MNRTVAGILGAVVVVAVVLLVGQRPAEAPSPSVSPVATGTAAAVTPTSTPITSPPVSEACQNTYPAGESPIVQPRKSGRSAEVALDSVRVGATSFGSTTRWNVRAFNPTGSGGGFEMPLRATVRTSAGAEVAVVGYEAGPPNAGSFRVTDPVAIDPCDPSAVPGSQQRGKVVLIVHTAPISSGSYVLTLRDVKLPEGGTREEAWTVALTCGAADPGNPGGVRCQ